jgi:ATP-dependent Lon protease
VKNKLEIIPVARMDEALSIALVRRPIPIRWVEPADTPSKPAVDDETATGFIAH